MHDDCQTLGLVLRLRVDFVLPLLQEEEEEPHQNIAEGCKLVNYMSKILLIDLTWLKITFNGRQLFMEDDL